MVTLMVLKVVTHAGSSVWVYSGADITRSGYGYYYGGWWYPTFNYPHLAEWSEERTKCCVTGIDRDSLSGTDSREERCRWTGKTTHGLIASLLAAVLSTSA